MKWRKFTKLARRVLPVFLISCLLIIFAGSGVALAQPTVTRDLPDTVVPGEEFDVVITFAASCANFTPSIDDVAPTGWTVAVDAAWCDPVAASGSPPVPWTSDTASYVWMATFDADTQFTVVYKVRVPLDATPGIYTFADGVLYYLCTGVGQTPVNVTGDTQVEVWIVPVASFTWDYTDDNGNGTLDAGEEIQFTDTSTNSPTSWSWDFDDGDSSTDQNPTHTYDDADTYTVTLTATNPGGSDMASDDIDVLPPFDAALSASWQVLYGADGAAGNPDCNLYILDPDTGAVVETIGPIGYAVTGLAFAPDGTLYGTTGRMCPVAPHSLIEIDLETGEGTLIGDIGIGTQSAADIAFGRDGVLYGWIEPESDDLAIIDLATGQATIIGESGLSTAGAGLGFTPDGALYFTGDDDNSWLRTINPVTGAPTNVVTMDGGGYRIGALASNVDGDLYGARKLGWPPKLSSSNGGLQGDHKLGDGDDYLPPCDLIIINTTTGHITVVGSTVDALDAIAFGPAVVVPPVADFRAQPREGRAPLTVQFTDRSTGDIDTWSWSFGDGESSRKQNPSHIYRVRGTYTVSLTVTGPGGTDREVKTDYIEVYTVVVAPANLFVRNLQISPTEAYPNQLVTISAEVVNQGGRYGSMRLDLVINGQAEDYTKAGVSPGTAKDISFTTSKLTPGTYNVYIEGETGHFTVLAFKPSPAGAGGLGTGGIIAIVIISIILIGGVIVAFMISRRPA